MHFLFPIKVKFEFAVSILKLVPSTRIELVIKAYQASVIPFNYKGKIGGSKGNRTPINGVTSHRTNHYTMRPLLSTICQFVYKIANPDKRIAVISGPVPRTVRPV